MKKFLKVLLIVMIFLPIGIILAGCDSRNYTLVNGVDFNHEEVFMTVGEELNLSYKVYPSNANNSGVDFYSSNESVASIDKAGNVKLKSVGEAIITIRTIDGGFIDTCKIVALVDPVQISFQSSKNTIKEGTDSDGSKFLYTYISVGEVKRLSVEFLNAEGKIDSGITNREVLFSSDNSKNVSVVNESGGVIKGVSNRIFASNETKAYSIITATLASSNTGEIIKSSIRVYVTESASIENLYISPYQGSRLTSQSTIVISSSDTGSLYKAYLLDYAGYNSDFDIFLSSSNEKIFKIETDIDDLPNNPLGFETYFKLIPGETEGNALLYVTISSSDADGYQISTFINVRVEGDVVGASITSNLETSKIVDDKKYDAVSVGDSFSLDFVYYGEGDVILKNIEREIWFGIKKVDEVYIKCLGQVVDTNSEYNYYNTNYFKIISATSNKIELKIMIAKNQGIITHKNIVVDYSFYIMDRLGGVFVTLAENDTSGISIIEMTTEDSKDVFLKIFSLLGNNGGGSSPVSITYTYAKAGSDLIESIVQDEYKYTITTKSGVKGSQVITFVANDGNVSVSYDLTIYIF